MGPDASKAKPEISVIIPTFRRPETLPQAISSVLAQSGTTMEILVVDDCPLGSAEPVVARFHNEQITYFRNPKPSGGRPAIVRNLGWRQASGTFFHFLDDDDLVPEGHYQAVKHAFSCAPEVGVVFGSVEPFGSDQAQLAHEVDIFSRMARRAALCQRFGPRMAFTAALLFGEGLTPSGGGIVRRECVEAVNGFDPELPVEEDGDFYLRIIRRFGAHFMSRVSIRYRIHPSLIHYRGDTQELFAQSFRRIHAKYREDKGRFEFYGLKAFERVLRIMV